MIDLFRPAINTKRALKLLEEVLTPDRDGRLYIGEGGRVKELERRFGALVGASPDNPPLAVNSCTSALSLALYLVAARKDCRYEVISTPMTCTATSGAIIAAGLHIVWADVDPITGLIDPVDVARKVTGDTAAVMAVDWAGRMCDYGLLREIAQGLPIIRDAAHALLATGPNADADYTCWSVGPIKHLSSGDGGFLGLAAEERTRARKLRWHGLDRESGADFRCAQTIEEAGFKYHQNDIMASILLAGLDDAEGIVARHRANAAWYDRALAGIPSLTLPPPDPGSSYWLYCLLVDDQADFIRRLAGQGIAASRVHARNDIHPAYHFPSGPLPGVDHFAAHEVAIPCGWWLSDRDRERVAEAVWSAAKVPA